MLVERSGRAAPTVTAAAGGELVVVAMGRARRGGRCRRRDERGRRSRRVRLGGQERGGGKAAHFAAGRPGEEPVQPQREADQREPEEGDRDRPERRVMVERQGRQRREERARVEDEPSTCSEPPGEEENREKRS